MSLTSLKARAVRLLPNNTFARGVSVLVGGTALAQLIAILALPILTRLYTPEAFSALAVFSSILALLTVISCLRFEIAIPLPKYDRIAAALCVLSVISVIVISSLSVLVVIFLPNIFDELADETVAQYLWLIPLGVFMVGMYNAMQYWSTRKKRFGHISKTRITQSLSGSSVKLFAGCFLGSWTPGLILGQVVAQGAGFLSLGVALVKHDWSIFKRLKPIYLKAAFKRYDKFPKYSTLEAFANTGSIQIPVLVIAYYAVGAEAGYLMVAMQLLSAPMSLVGKAVSQVYLSDGAERYHRGELTEFTNRTITSLAKVSSFPLLLAAVASPFILPFVLGEEWQRAGVLIAWMAPWFFMQFITSPVSMSLHITGNQKSAFLLQLVGLTLRVGSVFLSLLFSSDYVAEFFAVSGFVFYSIYLFLVLIIISKAE